MLPTKGAGIFGLGIRIIGGLAIAWLASTPALSAGQSTGAQLRLMHLITPQTGWAASDRNVYWTTNAGDTWKDVTPHAFSPAKIAAVYFLNASRGWVLLSTDTGKGSHPFAVAATNTAGAAWSLTPLEPSGAGVENAFSGDGSIDFADARHGWVMLREASSSNFSRGISLTTSDGGRTWIRLPDPPIAGTFVFTSSSRGWLAGGPAGDGLYVTSDGARSWQRQLVPFVLRENAASFATFGLPVFENYQRGFLPVTYSNAHGSTVALFSSIDAGRTWQFDRAIGGIKQTAPGASVASQVVDSTLVAASASSGRLAIAALGQRARRTRLANVLLPDSDVLNISFADAMRGWVFVATGRCAGRPLECTQGAQLLATKDGGASWANATPPALQAVLTWTSGKTLNAVPNFANHISMSKGFDQCSIAPTNQMQSWWTASPYGDTNVYIGGINRACGQPGLNSSYISALAQQGWGVIPTWVGLQAPCSGIGATFSSNPTVAQTQGISEAKKAAKAMSALGLAGTIVYYDMEAYPSSSCGEAVEGFIAGWVTQMHASGYVAGVYGSPSDAAFDWTAATSIPDDVWIALWNGQATVWNLSPLNNNLWANNQRIHQYAGGHNETWGGVTFNIDNDIEDAPVTGGGGK